MTTYFGMLFIRFTASAFRKLPSIYVFSYFPFGFEGRMWDLIVSVPFPNRWSFSYLKFIKYVTNIIAEPKYKYRHQEQAAIRNHNKYFNTLTLSM